MSGDLSNQEEIGDQSTVSKTDQSWMLIFTDLVSLMLTFFVLLFSMSVVKVEAWNNIVSALSQSLKPSERSAQSEAASSFDISTLSMRRAINLDYFKDFTAVGDIKNSRGFSFTITLKPFGTSKQQGKTRNFGPDL